MHPYQHIALAQHHIDDLQATARRHRLARRSRRERGPTDPPPAQR